MSEISWLWQVARNFFDEFMNVIDHRTWDRTYESMLILWIMWSCFYDVIKQNETDVVNDACFRSFISQCRYQHQNVKPSNIARTCLLLPLLSHLFASVQTPGRLYRTVKYVMQTSLALYGFTSVLFQILLSNVYTSIKITWNQ